MPDYSLRSRVVNRHVPEAVANFLRKNADYENGHSEFGAKAQIIDIARKYKKLKAAIWDDVELQNEGVVEVAEDMIGHLLLLIDLVSFEKSSHGRSPYPDPEFTAEAWLEQYHVAMRNLMELSTDG